MEQFPVLTLRGGLWRDQHGNVFDPRNPLAYRYTHSPDDADGGADLDIDPEPDEHAAASDGVPNGETGVWESELPDRGRLLSADPDGDTETGAHGIRNVQRGRGEPVPDDTKGG